MRYDIWGPLLRHLEISLLGVLLGCVVGIGLGALLRKCPRTASVAMGIVDVIQTVPTMAMLSMLMIVFGLNDTTVVITIFLYALFPILRNTYTGITGVDRGVVRAARGIGMKEGQILCKVELPLALPVILSGVRLAFVTALGVATTGVLIGAGGLGMLIWRGIQTRNTVMMLSGAIPVSLLAILTDTLLTALEKRLSRRGHAKKGREKTNQPKFEEDSHEEV